MNILLKLAIVSALALMLVPYSFANEWVPPDMIKALERPSFQPDLIAKGPTNVVANNPTNIGKTQKQGEAIPVQGSWLSRWVPFDATTTWVAPIDL